jgi:hypothetical protein
VARVVWVLVVAAIALGALGLYRYESTRAVVCGANAIPIGADLDSYVARLDQGVSRVELAPYLITCQARLDAANGEAQGTYLAYAAIVMLAATGCVITLGRRVY